MKGRREPASGPLQRLDAGARAIFPVSLTAFLAVMAAVPIGPPSLVIALALPCVFFWSLFRPAAMPPLAVFALGLLADLLSFQPLGVGVLLLLVTHGVAMRWRAVIARAPFLVAWLAFSALALGAAALGWLLQLVLTLQWPPLAPPLALAAMMLGMYPPLALVLSRMHMAMARAEDALR